MKKTIPFKKDIIFKTNLEEITSISLEHTLKIDNNILSGDFIVSGEYKITDSSIDTEKFSYELPFTISFDDKYKLDNAVVDIEDFYYEIINNSVLSVNIETMVDKIEEVLIDDKDMLIEDKIDDNDFEDVREEIKMDTIEERCIEDESNEEDVITERENNIIKEVGSIFDNISIEETYNTYKICIIRENDTIESVMEKYSVSKDTLELYNDLTEIKIGDKIIIPVVYEGN